MYTFNFHEISKEDISIAGGKGANLGEMISCGIPVPEGFIISAEGYRHFIRQGGLEEAFYDLLNKAGDDEEMLSRAAGEIRGRILESPLPDDLRSQIQDAYEALKGNRQSLRLAVRSSATAEDLPDDSFAGQQETYLNVCGLDDVFTHVRKCYASLWGNRAVSYRLHRGYSQTDVALAVVIQEMVESEKAGVLFTINPVTNNASQMQINASFGLGESVVSGRVTADSILCDKDGKLLSYEIGSKKTQIIYDEKNTREVSVEDALRASRCLSETEISSLCTEGNRIEKHYGHPMDIEWAIRDGKVYILQARAITTFHKEPDDGTEKALIAAYLKGTKISGPAMSNMAFQLEKMPYAYRPLDYDFMIQINTQKAVLFGEAGLNLTSDPQMDDDGIMTLPKSDFGLNKRILHFPAMLKLLKDFPACADKCLNFMPAYEEKLGKMQAYHFDDMSLKKCGEFLSYAYKLLGKLCYDRFKYALFPSVLGGHLTKAVKKLDSKYTNYDLYKGLNNKTALITNEVSELAESIRSHAEMRDDILSGMDFLHLRSKHPDQMSEIDAYLQRNGFKSDFNCYCVIAKTLNEDPDRLLNILRPLLGCEQKGSCKDPGSEYDEMLAGLSEIYGKKFPALKKDIECFRTFHVVREESQYLWESLLYHLDYCFPEIMKRDKMKQNYHFAREK